MLRFSYIILLLVAFFQGIAIAQIQTPHTPQPQTFQPIQADKSYQYYTPQPTYKKPNPMQQVVQNRNAMMGVPTIKTSPSGTPQQVHQQIVYEYKQHLTKQGQQRQEIQRILNEERGSKPRYVLPDYHSPEFMEKTRHYRQAFDELKNMLDGKQDMKVKDAVFAVENAFLDNTMNYAEYDKKIQEYATVCKLFLIQNGYNPNNGLAANWAIQEFMADTVKIDEYWREGVAVYYPMKYDFEDIYGDTNWTKQFVMKLIMTNSGQCHSLPLMYKILAEELNAEAYLSLAPNHYYIQFEATNGNWYNYETTNGTLTSDAWIMGSGFVSQAAMKSKIYMDTLSLKQTVGMCLLDLAAGYEARYGIADGDFILQCADLALSYFPENENNVNAQMFRYETYRKMLIRQMYIDNTKDIKQVLIYPEIKAMYDKFLLAEKKIIELGYEDMPKAAYEAWLKQLDEEKQKQESQTNYLRMMRFMK